MIDKRNNGQEVRTSPKEAPERHKQPAGYFAGWISEKWGIAWSVSKSRRDKRTGAIPQKIVTDKVYILQYSERQPGDHRSFAKFQGIAAKDHIEAAQKAIEFMEFVNLAQLRRDEATLFYNERKIALWIGQNENAANAK